MSLYMEVCTLDALLLDVVHMLRPKAEEKGLEFAAEHAKAVSALIQTDKTKKLQQILINLVANAIKFTSEGNVRLQVARGGTDHLQFAVVDTGRGIAEEEKAAVFKAFQHTQSGVQSQEGTGLGDGAEPEVWGGAQRTAACRKCCGRGLQLHVQDLAGRRTRRGLVRGPARA